MIVFRARLALHPAHREEVIRSFLSVVGPTRAMPGCADCQLWLNIDDGNVLELAEKWNDEPSLRAYVQADSFRVILSALEYASRQPDVRFETISDTRGMEFIAACLDCSPA
jgi:quinol monooxygenase YgiN